ncbi:cation/H+ exchanger protein 1 isoform X2 [Erpetoichthys calabaricus]|uniref:Cation/H+ exchanger protein 2 n=1 Tax=Erpetoichthys calabaricus TaxID=27687 RepID=A0A8C4RKF0_ERPCA|nr:cation/H+ exchanger protein 1 isoform X2 [Erpetoichthys calabaricus]
MSTEVDNARRRRFTQDALDLHRDSEHRAETHQRRGSLCDKHCAFNIPPELMDTHSPTGSHYHHHHHSLLTPRYLPAISTPNQCHHCSGDAQLCEGCAIKTTITAENEVEANKLANNYKFGFKKWKSHVTARPWEDRSDIVKELHSDLKTLKFPDGSVFSFGNVIYIILFGWWLCLAYLLVAFLMFLTILGIPYGKLCWSLAGYFLWPFGKCIQKTVRPGRNVRFHFSKCEAISEVDEARETTPLVGTKQPDIQDGTSSQSRYWCRPSTYLWLLLGFPFMFLIHSLACILSWIFVFTIPVTKMNARTIGTVLLMPPELVHIKKPKQTDVHMETEMILCCYHAFNLYYYKYTVDGINVFAVNLLPVVVVALALGYADKENKYASSYVKFTISLLSIIPLSYYIGMAIASISAQSNFAVGAVVNATFGSVIELTFYITALIKGSQEKTKCYEEIVKSALTGTLLGCVLFIPGLCMVIGGCKHQEQRFNSRSAGISSALLFISVGGAFAPTLFSKAYGNIVCQDCSNTTENATGPFVCRDCHYDLTENNYSLFHSHIEPLVYTVSILLPAAYLVGLIFTLKTHSHIYDIHISDCHVPGHHHSPVVYWARWRALIILIFATLLMSSCADLVTENIQPIFANSSVSQYFIGVTVLAMVPELPEIVNGIQFALQNNISLSIEVGNCIAVQVCMLQIPVLVLFNVFYPVGFVLLFSDLHLWACIFSVILINYIFMDGKCDYFQGAALVVVYLILLAMYYFAPSPAGC